MTTIVVSNQKLLLNPYIAVVTSLLSSVINRKLIKLRTIVEFRSQAVVITKSLLSSVINRKLIALRTVVEFRSQAVVITKLIAS